MLLRLRTISYKKIPTMTAIAKIVNVIIAVSASRTVNTEERLSLSFKTICWLSHVTLLSPIEWEADTPPRGDARYVCQRDRYSIALLMLFVNYCLNRGGRGNSGRRGVYRLKRDLQDTNRIFRSRDREVDPTKRGEDTILASSRAVLGDVGVHFLNRGGRGL